MSSTSTTTHSTTSTTWTTWATSTTWANAQGDGSQQHRADARLRVFEAMVGSAWSQLQPELRRLCRRWMGGNAADGDEALSRASLAIYLQLPRHRPRIDHIEPWIRRVTFNTCMDLHRETRRRAEVALEIDSLPPGLDRRLRQNARSTPPAIGPDVGGPDVGGPGVGGPDVGSPERDLLDGELRQKIDEAIAALPERLRSTLEVHLEADSYAEVARHMAITRANARKRIQQARQSLRVRLGHYLGRRH